MSVIENTKDRTENLMKCLDSIAKSEGFTTHICEITEVNSNGGNYLGEISKVVITGETILGEKRMNIFLKRKLSEYIKVVSINDIYSRELFAYRALSDLYNQLQEEFNVPFKERYKFVKCYEESNTDMIIMEDMSSLGYTNYNRFNIITIEYAQMCVKQLAKFHALSFILEKEKLDYFNCNIKLLKYPLIYNEEYVAFFNHMSEFALKHLEGEYKTKLESYGDICEKYYQCVNNTSVIRCLCHGDYRVLNIMTDFSKPDHLDSIPIDYQFIYYGSPVLDILNLIFGSTDRKFRKQHLEYLKNLYHDTLTEFLKYFNMDVNLFYPRKDFDKAFQESLEFGLMTSVCFLPVNLAEGDDIKKLSQTSVVEFNLSINERIKSRLEDVIDDLTEWGVFKTDKEIENEKL